SRIIRTFTPSKVLIQDSAIGGRLPPALPRLETGGGAQTTEGLLICGIAGWVCGSETRPHAFTVEDGKEQAFQNPPPVFFQDHSLQSTYFLKHQIRIK